MVTVMDLILLILVIFWLVVIYHVVGSQNEKRHRHDKDDRNHWPLHHA